MKKLTIKQKKFADEYIISVFNRYGVVYKLINMVNGKIYIGITTRTLDERFNEHCAADSYIGRAIRKYGINNFIKQVIDYADTHEELMGLEIDYIKYYDSFNSGYNQTIGGDGVIYTEDLTLEFTDVQKKFLDSMIKYNKKEVDVFDNIAMLKCMVLNLVMTYITSIKPIDKIRGAKLILKLKPYLLKQVIELNVLTLDELKHYSCQKMSSFEVYNGCE